MEWKYSTIYLKATWRIKTSIRSFYLLQCNERGFEVKQGDRNFTMNLLVNHCDCGFWDISGISYAYVLAYISNKRCPIDIGPIPPPMKEWWATANSEEERCHRATNTPKRFPRAKQSQNQSPTAKKDPRFVGIRCFRCTQMCHNMRTCPSLRNMRERNCWVSLDHCLLVYKAHFNPTNL